jgi:hypothetical protein
LHAYAKKAPKLNLPKGSSKGAVDHAKLNHEHLVQIVDKLCKHPQYIQGIHGILMSSAYPVVEQTFGADGWQGAVACLGRIPRGWMAGWLLQRLGAHGLTSDLLKALDRLDSSHIQELVAYETQLPLTVAIPTLVAEDPAKVGLLLTRRADAVGPRVQKLLEAKAISNGGISWREACYTLDWVDDLCTRVRHCQGEVVHLGQLTHVVIPRGFALERNDSDVLAKVVLAPTTYTIMDLVGEGAKFRENIVTGKKSDQLEALAREMCCVVPKAAEEAESKGAKLVAESAAARKAASTAKARAAVQERTKQRGVRRRVDLASQAQHPSKSAK